MLLFTCQIKEWTRTHAVHIRFDARRQANTGIRGGIEAELQTQPASRISAWPPKVGDLPSSATPHLASANFCPHWRISPLHQKFDIAHSHRSLFNSCLPAAFAAKLTKMAPSNLPPIFNPTQQDI